MTSIPIIKITDGVLDKFGDPTSYIQSHYTKKIFMWCVNSDYRHAVWLESWLKPQIDNPDKNVLDFIQSHPQFSTGTDDERMMSILRCVHGTIRYVSDNQSPFDNHAEDYWQTASQTIEWKQGDCEDGAILQYVLARLVGIPAGRLCLWAGDTTLGGHCCLIYRPKNYPLNWAFMDWCLYPSDLGFGDRPLFVIIGTTVLGEAISNGQQTGASVTTYQKMWFSFSENASYLEYIYDLSRGSS